MSDAVIADACVNSFHGWRFVGSDRRVSLVCLVCICSARQPTSVAAALHHHLGDVLSKEKQAEMEETTRRDDHDDRAQSF